MNSYQLVFAVFASSKDMNAAYRNLQHSGFNMNKVSIVVGPLTTWIISALKESTMGGSSQTERSKTFHAVVPTNKTIDHTLPTGSSRYVIIAFGSSKQLTNAEYLFHDTATDTKRVCNSEFESPVIKQSFSH